MGRVNLQSGMKSIGEESVDSEVTMSNKAAFSCMINSEIAAVLAIMRRNDRWGGEYMWGDDEFEHPLVQSLKVLRKQVFMWRQPWHWVNPVLYLQPFLDVIQSDETTPPITSVALSSVYKFLTFDMLDLNTANVEYAMHLVVDAVTKCRFEKVDPVSEEVVLMKILQVLLACMKSKASIVLRDHHVFTIVKTCFQIVTQAATKGELLQRLAANTTRDLIICIFSHLPAVDNMDQSLSNGKLSVKSEVGCDFSATQPNDCSANSEHDGQLPALGPGAGAVDENGAGNGEEAKPYDLHLMMEPYGVPCMFEIFHFLCSLLNYPDQFGIGPGSNSLESDEDAPLFALGLINSAIELGGASFGRHPRLLNLIQTELFRNLIAFGLSPSPLVLSTVCSIVLNLYHHLRKELTIQLEAFFSHVILRLAQRSNGVSYLQQEVAMEAIVDFCRQKTFMADMYANYDCEITCSNVFEEIVVLLSESVSSVNSPLSTMHILAVDGLVAVFQGMVERISNGSHGLGLDPVSLEEYAPFWTVKCDNYSDPNHWVPFVHRRKYIKSRLMEGADLFNRDPKKGFEFLQREHLLPEKLDPQSVAYFLRYAPGLDKNVIGDFLGNPDEFSVQVLHAFAETFDFQDTTLDTALRLFLETFRLPGEAQKIHRVLEAFSERYYEQCRQIFANKDAAFVLSYSVIMLNTDLHNAQVKKKMTEEDFIRNNRRINGGNDLPREFLSELYRAICENEIQIRTSPKPGAGFAEKTSSGLWIDLILKSKKTAPYIATDSRAHLDRDMFAIMCRPAVSAISKVFDHADPEEEVYQLCIDGFLAIARVSAFHRVESVCDDLVVALCKSTTLFDSSSGEDSDPVLAIGEDPKVKTAIVTLFTIATNYGDYIRLGWRTILDCILSLQKLRLLPACLASEPGPTSVVKPTSKSAPGLLSRFTKLLSFDTEEIWSQPTEDQLAAQRRAAETIQKCHIDSIFTDSKFLQPESLLKLTEVLIKTAQKKEEDDEEIAVFCLELLIRITLNNRDRIVLLWRAVYEHIARIVGSTNIPCVLVEKAVFGLLRICQRLLPYKETLADELLRSLQLVLKLDARVADTYCEPITQEVGHLVRASATHIRSQFGWRMIVSLLSVTARHTEASEAGFDTLSFVMCDGAHLVPANFVLCVDSARQFAESRVGGADRSIAALNLMSGSVGCLVKWARGETKEAGVREEDPNLIPRKSAMERSDVAVLPLNSEDLKNAREEDPNPIPQNPVIEGSDAAVLPLNSAIQKDQVQSGKDAVKMPQDVGDMWLKLLQALKRVCLDQREEVRNHALLALQRCMIDVDGAYLEESLWLRCFDDIIFTTLDDLLEIAQGQSQKEYRNIEGTLMLAMKLLSKVFLHRLPKLSHSPTFGELWLGVLTRVENYTRVKIRGRTSKKLQELLLELLKNMLLVMKNGGVFIGHGESLWDPTWVHVNKISPTLQSEIFPSDGTTLPLAVKPWLQKVDGIVSV